jgi:hypothetical protein
MALNGRLGPMRNLLAGDDVGVGNGLCQVVDAGAENKADGWLVAGAIAYDSRCTFYLNTGEILVHCFNFTGKLKWCNGLLTAFSLAPD